MYFFQASKSYQKSLSVISKNDERLKLKIFIALQKLAMDPHNPSLHSHKVNTLDYGIRWSSKITGDLRVIWDYDTKERLIILLLDIGGHSGKRKVYK